ncbi:MAG: response regulator [Aestuariibaculum sp.]
MKPLLLMLIEDDEIESIKFDRALSRLNRPYKTIQAKNGEEALKTLNETPSLPHLIIMDLNMPKMNGLEFLSALKQNSKLLHIPIIVLTTSENTDDVTEAYRQGVAGYIVKPLKYDDYLNKIKTLIEYWDINEFNGHKKL